MAKWRRRPKAGPSGSPEQGTQAKDAGRPPGLNGVDDLRGELESLKEELSSAKAQAAERELSLPKRSKRGLAVAAGAVTVGAGVTAGVLLADRGGHSRLAAPVTAAPTSQPNPGSAPSSSAPSSSVPVSSSPSTASAPPVPPPPTAGQVPSGQAPSGQVPSGQVIVPRAGSFWSIAQSVETQSLGRTPTNAEVARYWLALIAANRSRLIRPGDANLIYAGQIILLPPI